jgi:signal transduction histidine kinase
LFVFIGITLNQALAAPPPFFAVAAGPLDPLLAAALYGVGLNAVYFVAAYVFGNQAWESARRQHQLVVQGEQLRRSQAENARQAVMAERVRIARDLHDVVAHHVSVMGVQASAARRVLDSDPVVASQALSAVESTARTAIQELSGLLGVLRADQDPPDDADTARPGDADTARPGDGDTARPGGVVAPIEARPPMPGLDQITRLVDETRATGLRVTYAVYGEPRKVPDAMALSAYRVVQEALTNTVKHAAATTADVRIRFLEASLEVEVNDDGHGGDGSVPGSGLGLVGMRERVAVHGGQLDVGPRRTGGFQVRARFRLGVRPAATVSG